MKKLKQLVFIFMALLVITGCGSSKKESASDQLKEAMLKMKDIEAISLKAEINLGTEEMKLPMAMEFDIKKDNFRMKYGMNLFGMEYSQEMYMISKEDESYVYTYDSESETWSYTKGESVFDISITDVKDEEISYEEAIEEYLESILDLKEVETDKKGYTKMEVSISRENLKKMIKEHLTAEEFKDYDMTEIDNFPEKLTFYIYLKDGEMSIISFDVSKMDMGDLTSDLEGMSVFDVTIEITGLNDKVNITLPKEAESATYISPEDMDFFGSNEDDDDDFLDEGESM